MEAPDHGDPTLARTMKHRRDQQRRPDLPIEGAHIRPATGPTPTSSYSSPIDAVVLAGTSRNPRHRIGGGNKAFLSIDGQQLVQRVVDALVRAPSIDRIFVVGPVEPLQAALRTLCPHALIVGEVGKMIRNAWEGFQRSDRLRGGFQGATDPDRPVLFLSCDTPLINPAAVDDFVSRCAAVDAAAEGRASALLVGLAEEASLTPYYPQGGRPGIVRPYVELRSGRYRLANIYVARPLRMANREILQTGFTQRKAKDVRNVLRLVLTFLRRPGGWRAAWEVLNLQAARLAQGRSARLYGALRRRNTMERIEAIAESLLGGPLRLVVTPFGGLSLDVDDDADYRVLRERFAEWYAPADTARGARPA